MHARDLFFFFFFFFFVIAVVCVMLSMRLFIEEKVTDKVEGVTLGSRSARGFSALDDGFTTR